MQLVKKGQVGVGWALNPICLVSLCKGEKHTHTGRRCHVVLEPDGSDAATAGRQKLPVRRLLPLRLQKERCGAHALISGSGLQAWETIPFSPFQHAPTPTICGARYSSSRKPLRLLTFSVLKRLTV